MLTTRTLADRLFHLIRSPDYRLDYDRASDTDANVWDILTLDNNDEFSRRAIHDVLEMIAFIDGADEMNEDQLYEEILNASPEFADTYTEDLMDWTGQGSNIAEVEEVLDDHGWTRGGTFGLIVQAAQQRVGERIAQHVCRAVVEMVGDEFDPYPEDEEVAA